MDYQSTLSQNTNTVHKLHTNSSPTKCCCCLSEVKPVVNLQTCKHTVILQEIYKMDLPLLSVCLFCHSKLVKIQMFQNQVRESCMVLKKQIPCTMTKLNNLQQSQTTTFTLPNPETETDTETETVKIELDPDDENMPFDFATKIKFENDSSSSDFENDLALSEVEKTTEPKPKKQKITPTDDKYKGKNIVCNLNREDLEEERDRESKKESYIKLPFRCESCVIGFDHENTLKNHIDKQHSKKKGGFESDTCKTILGPVSYKKHTRSANVHEMVETMDLSEEEAEEIMAANPGHVQRWVDYSEGRDTEAQEWSFLKPLTPSTSAAERFDGASGGVSVHDLVRDLNPSNTESMSNLFTEDAGVRPSTSGVTATSMPVSRSLVDYGSDFDSEFDDEFDVPTIENNVVFNGRCREIPEDEDLEEPVREVINAVERAMDDEADRMIGVSPSFIWEKEFETFRGIPETFSDDAPGPIKNFDTPYDCFIEIWDKEILERIAQETNRYAKQMIDGLKAKGLLKPSSRLHQRVPTDAD